MCVSAKVTTMFLRKLYTCEWGNGVEGSCGRGGDGVEGRCGRGGDGVGGEGMVWEGRERRGMVSLTGGREWY